MSVGALGAIVNSNVAGFVGVRLTPPDAVAKDGVRVIVLATVPVCSCICIPCPVNTASVVFGGIVKGAVRPPVENWTAGSAGRLLDTSRVITPAIAIGYGLESFRLTAGCVSGSACPLGPTIL